MKILITTDTYSPMVNGVIVSVNNLAKGLRARGHEVRILTLANETKSYTENDITYIGSIDAGKIYPDVRIKLPRQYKAVSEIIRWKPNIIHSQCEFSTFTAAKNIAEKTGTLIVHTYHTNYEEYTQYFSPCAALGKQAVKKLARYISGCSSRMIAPSNKVKILLENYGCTSPIEVIPTGLDLENIICRKELSERNWLKERFGIAADKKIIMFAGRIAKEKNLDEIIEYLGMYRPENALFLIVGGGPYEKKIKEKIISCGISDMTVMTGMVEQSEIKNYYGIADIFVSASQSETQGLTYAEALANGVPLLCKKNKCLDGTLIDGATGYYFDCSDSFLKGLSQMLHSDISYMKGNAVLLAQEKYSIESFAEKAEQAYVKTLNMHHR